MPVDLLSIGVLCLCWGTTYLIHSTLLAAGVWGFLRLRPATGHLVREALWKTVLIGGLTSATGQMLLLPAGPLGNLTWNLPFLRGETIDAAASNEGLVRTIGLHNITEAAAGTTARLNSVEPEQEIWIVMDTNQVAPTGLPTANLAETAGVATESMDTVRPLSSIGTIPFISKIAAAAPLLVLCVVALVAVAVGLLRSLYESLALSRKLAACTLVNAGPARELLDELCRLLPRASPVRLLAAADNAEPAALGVRYWTIILPRRAAEDLSSDELKSLLAHELAHLVRGDAAWLWISRVVCSCLAFQPLNHLARREWQRAAEFLCDAWAIRHTGNPLALARCLTEVAGWRLGGQSSAALLAATGRKSGLVARIERLLDARPHVETGADRRNRQRAVLLGAAGLVFLAWCTPRVNVIAAGSSSDRRTTESAPVAANAKFAASQDLGSTAEAAKSQAGGEFVTDAGDATTDGEVANEDRAQIDPQSVARMLAALDRELAALEAELGEIEPLLQNATGVPQIAQLAMRLQSEIASLKQRREFIRVKSKSFVR